MSETKFTKRMEIGISTYNAPLCVDGFCNVDGQRFEVCAVWGVDDDSVECDQSKANAHLIAAAPEMYDMLKRLSAKQWDASEEEEIENLLAKARGEK